MIPNINPGKPDKHCQWFNCKNEAEWYVVYEKRYSSYCTYDTLRQVMDEDVGGSIERIERIK